MDKILFWPLLLICRTALLQQGEPGKRTDPPWKFGTAVFKSRLDKHLKRNNLDTFNPLLSRISRWPFNARLTLSYGKVFPSPRSFWIISRQRTPFSSITWPPHCFTNPPPLFFSTLESTLSAWRCHPQQDSDGTPESVSSNNFTRYSVQD